MQIELVPQPGEEWDRFVEAMPGATLSHAAAWASVICNAYRLKPCYLAARDSAGALAGVLPLVRFRTLGGRRELVSMPFHDCGGILARDSEAERALLDAALHQARESGAQALELRQTRPIAALPAAAPSVERIDLVLPLQTDEQAQWNAFRAKVRNQTRKAEREGLRILQGRPEEMLLAFYHPFCVNMRDLGSPVHAKSFYRAAAHHFGERLRFIAVGLEDRPVAGLVAIRYAHAVTVTWASALRSERHRCPNNLIYWEAIRWAIAEGAREFDFGRSPPESGTYRFKRGWGAEERPLAWLRLSPDGEPLAVNGPGGAGLLQRLSAAWMRLPLPIASLFGPRVRRFLAN
jgi:FemAB-related protein (PEP-CTERM system-associated)